MKNIDLNQLKKQHNPTNKNYMRKNSALILITVLFMFGCHNPVKEANKYFEDKLNGPISQEIKWFGETVYFLYNDKSKYWYPEEMTNQDILDDKLKEGFKRLSSLEKDVQLLSTDDSQISASIDKLLKQIKIAKEKIKETQDAIDSANSLFFGIGGMSGLMTIFRAIGSKEGVKRIGMPENVRIAYDDLDRSLIEKIRFFAHKINEIENEAFIQINPTIEEKREIRKNLLSLMTAKINLNCFNYNLLALSNLEVMEKDLFDYYENKYKLSNNNELNINSNTGIPKNSNDTISLDGNSKTSTDMKLKVETTLKQLVQEWNQGYLSKDVNTFSHLFANSILFYGLQQNIDECIQSKLSLFKRYPDFHQQIYGDIDIVNSSVNEYKCYFIKRVTINQKITDYPSYLVFGNFNEEWKIIAESDLVTDKNLSKKKLSKTSTDNQKKYPFEPSISVISGVLIIENYFGSPGYGDNPETDEREYSYILMLEKPIDVISNTEKREEGDSDSTTSNISEIQLASTKDIKLSNYKNKAIRLTGTFFGANTGHHHTKVLLDVQKIEEL